MNRHTLRDTLRDWTDIDSARFHLARCLGLMGPEVRFHLEAKHVFWSNNPIGNVLVEMLDGLVAVGVLEKRDEPDFQYRWSPVFVGSWERAGRQLRTQKSAPGVVASPASPIRRPSLP